MEFSDSLNMKTPSEHVLVRTHKIHESVTLSSIIPSSSSLSKNEERLELTFLDSLKFNREDKEEVFFWFSVSGSMSSLNIALSIFSDTHVSVFTFSSAITSSFLLLHLSIIPGESNHVSYMIDKSSCTIYKVKRFLGSSLCFSHCSRT